MAYCPYCGTITQQEERYCVRCGKALPEDLHTRILNAHTPARNKWWILPIAVFISSVVIFGATNFYLDSRIKHAKEDFHKGEQAAIQGQYKEAKAHFISAEEKSYHFPAATKNKQFTTEAIALQSTLDKAEVLRRKKQYQEALQLIDEAESSINNYDGEAVKNLIDHISALRNETKLAQIETILKEEPAIEQLKSLLWQAESIPTKEAKQVTLQIRKELIAYSSTNATKQLKGKQYNKAQAFIEDGLRYAPKNEKLLSLETTIAKEQAAFETAQQQRMEQAIIAAEKEQEMNQNDAVKVTSIQAKRNDFHNIVVKGKLESVATVPINTISITYHLVNNKGEEVLSNEVYVYPDTLYPGEKGNFEYTHYDLSKDVSVEVDKVNWFLY
ncbi:zinc ribbon domain-containing protein [Pontibacillus litoralis]|uniref:Zinc ribbon domain-containing protein n=1 Tax=Pontibacillus litoralis JSM 072002 TaxID=1385512 RepID=A0A0A5G4C1_9BACI|nr:hypothetical protein [Pontibacillus litoralis]KGX86904.1 hypothetical protein N784_03360 [Pontibacillus litoralis JSM 072002]